MRTITAGVNFRVLLVDDDQDQYVLTRDLLGDDPASHFQLDWAANFEDGLRLFATVGYDVALVDYRLGARDGLELLQTETVRHAGVPAIMLTGEGDARVDVEATAAGAVDYLVKDEVTAPRLKRALRQAVERHRAVTDARVANAAELARVTQQLDALGQLATSAAHGVIDLLTVVAGYTELLLDSGPGEAWSRLAVEQIQTAGKRLAAPTHQLLAFSRKAVLPKGLGPQPSDPRHRGEASRRDLRPGRLNRSAAIPR